MRLQTRTSASVKVESWHSLSEWRIRANGKNTCGSWLDATTVLATECQCGFCNCVRVDTERCTLQTTRRGEGIRCFWSSALRALQALTHTRHFPEGNLCACSQALLLTEPDVKVLRPHWVDHFLALLDLPERWWIRASPWIDKRGTWSSMRRTNGNGLYRTDDPDAIRFIQWALQSEGFRGYNDQIWLAHADLMSTCWSARHLASRVVYTSLIVNLGLLCTTFNASSVRAAYPDASIAHISGNC